MAKDFYTNLDLNLLRTFIILHQEKNMRQAAKRLFVSQPAVSKALQKMRTHFDNELFVKTATGLTPTEFADDLAENVGPIIDQLSLALNSATTFEPAHLTGVLKVALSPFILSSFASDIFQAIKSQAPNVSVQLLNWSKSTMQEIINDEILLGVNYEIGHAPKELIAKKVAQDQFHVYVRDDHPFQGSSITLEQTLGYEIATIIAADWNSHTSIAEKLLKMRGLNFNIAFRSELPSAVIDVVMNSDMLFPASSLINDNKLAKLRRLPILVDNEAIKPEVCAYYHHKNRQNETALWLKSLIEQVLKQNNS